MRMSLAIETSAVQLKALGGGRGGSEKTWGPRLSVSVSLTQSDQIHFRVLFENENGFTIFFLITRQMHLLKILRESMK